MSILEEQEEERFSKSNYSQHLERLKEAYSWLGISRGRPVEYLKLIREFFEEHVRSRQHILAYNESCEIVEFYIFWESRLQDFRQLKPKLVECLKKGPLLREDENSVTSTNKYRNESFVYLLAGELLDAAINVIAIDGIVKEGEICHLDGDISFKWKGTIYDIQCKRIQTKARLKERVKEARDQITRSGREEQCGLIAIDLSALMPRDKVVESNSAETSGRRLSRLLETEFKGTVEKYLDSSILGFLLTARIAGMTRVNSSPILSSAGEYYAYMRPETIKPWLMVSEPARSNDNICRFLYERLAERLRSFKG